mmetsp:Transcript_36135/g.112511  ORF Transcript_36135/g.112511 Transcript_36135/m.112511 type:complete len:242 (+) Transcript_36135:76-801(+)
MTRSSCASITFLAFCNLCLKSVLSSCWASSAEGSGGVGNPARASATRNWSRGMALASAAVGRRARRLCIRAAQCSALLWASLAARLSSSSSSAPSSARSALCAAQQGGCRRGADGGVSCRPAPRPGNSFASRPAACRAAAAAGPEAAAACGLICVAGCASGATMPGGGSTSPRRSTFGVSTVAAPACGQRCGKSRRRPRLGGTAATVPRAPAATPPFLAASSSPSRQSNSRVSPPTLQSVR